MRFVEAEHLRNIFLMIPFLMMNYFNDKSIFGVTGKSASDQERKLYKCATSNEKLRRNLDLECIGTV